MTTQRGIGILYTAFASLVFISTMISRYVTGIQLFSDLDFITIACIIVFFLSIFIESKLLKTLQVIMILLVCVGIIMQGNYYLSLALFTNIFFILYSYGAYNKYPKIKMAVSVLLIYAMYLATSVREGETFVYGFNWIIFVVVHITSIWIVFRATVDKARKFDASKEMQLNHKIDQMTAELYKTQNQLKDAVTSGLELLEMVKELKNGKR
jgi:hypothetical protein